MDGIIEAFHLDIKLLIAQLINFSIVLIVLYKFAYKPLLKTMNERTGKIEKGLKDAKKSQEQLEESEKMRDQSIKEAKKEARELLEKMQGIAEKNRNETVTKAQDEANKIIENAKKEIEAEKEKMIKEVKKEVGKLTGVVLEKVLGQKQEKEIDDRLIDEAVSEIKK